MARNQKRLVTQNHLPGLLLASEAECERWIAAGLIPVAERQPVRKGGRTLQKPLFDADRILRLAGEVPAWRRHEDDAVHARRSEAARSKHAHGAPADAREREPGGAVRRRKAVLTAARTQTGPALAELTQLRRGGEPIAGSGKPPREFGGYRATFVQEIALASGAPITVAFQVTLPEPPTVAAFITQEGRYSPADVTAAAEVLTGEFGRLRILISEASEQVAEGWREELDTYLSAYEEHDRAAILQGIRAAATRLDPVEVSALDMPDTAARRLRGILDDLRARATARRLRHMREVQIREASGYERYAALFPLARSLGREVLFLAGPTNSGKTHEALGLAAEAGTAEILSPLRLLALEHYERLAESGLSAGMITGEERLVPEGATHIARTIETVDLGRAVDVCVIDEVQMLGDHSRGWAWTQAVLGAAGRLVVLTGAPEAIPLVEHLLAMTGERLKVRILKRKGELRVERQPVDLKQVDAGDAVIAFSRAEIHDLRTRLVRLGRSVATVYGALGPEVRRAEAARFRNREAEILVATDAIGMGLNIGPLRRVVFSTLSKFDGTRRRPLSPMEIKQIAGRAGRFGHHDVGLVSALPDAGPYRTLGPAIETALHQDGVALRGKAYVRPNQETVLAASKVLHTDRLGQILRHLNETLVAGHPDLRMADIDEMIGLAQHLDAVPLSILDRLSYATAPVDARDGLAVDMLVAWAYQHAQRGWVQPPNFGFNADLLKLEARVKIATSWLWLSQRYGSVYEDAEAVQALRSELNARIEDKLVSSSVSRIRDSAGKRRDKARGEKGRGGDRNSNKSASKPAKRRIARDRRS